MIRPTTKLVLVVTSLLILGVLLPLPVSAQLLVPEAQAQSTDLQASAGPGRQTLTNQVISFGAGQSTVPDANSIREIRWDFGDNTSAIGDQVTHAYADPGKYLVRLTIITDFGSSEDTTEIQVFDQVLLVIADSSANLDQLTLSQQQAADAGLLLLPLIAKSGGPDALVEEELTQLLVNAQEEFRQANLIVAWTSGGVGINVLSRFAQNIKQSDELAFTNLAASTKGVVFLSETPFGVLAPTAQSTFNQIRPAFIILTRPEALSLLIANQTAEEAKDKIIASPIEYRLLGSFSARAISDIGLTNFMSSGINYLINQGVPINNIVLILMIPVIATILSFTRQVIGIKAFGLITPAMTTLSLLVLGLIPGLIVFIVVLLSGTMTRFLLRKLRLLYLPRMALVLTSASLAILVMLGFGVAAGRTATLSFSIFPILILIILAEEFIAAQFSRNIRTALTTTAWTLALAVLCYFIVSWQLLRTTLLSYPEAILLAIPINIALGRFSGLRLTEYFRFRHLLRMN